MNIPTIPTDNLYKFIAIFGLLISLTGTYLFQNNFQEINSEIDKLDIEYEQIKVKNPFYKKILLLKDSLEINKVIEFKTDSVSFIKRYRKLENRVNSLKHDLQVYIFIIFLGIGISIFGFCKWYIKLQIYQDKIVKNEASKLEGDKSLHIHKIQFEKEFNIYETIWTPLVALKKDITSITDDIEIYIQSDNLKRDEITKNYKNYNYEFWSHHNDFKFEFENNRPFIPQVIYDKVSEFLYLCVRLFVYKDNMDFFTKGLEKGDLLKEISNNYKLVILKIDEICDSIRKRIELIDIIE
jgi:hypothetical protein